ncbi:MAG TPA: hypothetical protein VG325_07640 [Solirubrobacteraceae bacterium]|jgi:hypothetical protein|nr:hypothetical protein [Solirubrobacteraceae bacterium]
MTLIPLGTTRRRKRLIDEAIRAYVGWREECAAVWDTYRRWTSAEPREAAVAFAAYMAALDREERASGVYVQLSRRVGDVLMSHREPATDLAASGDRPQ